MKTEREKKLPSLLILVFVDSAWGAWAPYTMQYISPWDCPHPEQNETPYNVNFSAETKRIGFRTRWQISEKSDLVLSETPTATMSAPQRKHSSPPRPCPLEGHPRHQALIGEQITFLAPLSNILFPIYCLGTQKWQSCWEPMTRKGRMPKKWEIVRKESHSRFFQVYANPNRSVGCRDCPYLMKSLHLETHTNMNHLAFVSFCNPEELCWGLCPAPPTQTLNGIIRNGTVQVAKSK